MVEVVAPLALAAVPVGLAVLTGTGARRRGAALPVCLLCAIVFPVAWVLWYVEDDGHAAREH